MKKVWIVDDDRSIRWVLEKALQKAEIPVQTFQSADEVLNALKTETPSVLVSDIRMTVPYPVTKEAHLNIFRSLLTSAKPLS